MKSNCTCPSNWFNINQFNRLSSTKKVIANEETAMFTRAWSTINHTHSPATYSLALRVINIVTKCSTTIRSFTNTRHLTSRFTRTFSWNFKFVKCSWMLDLPQKFHNKFSRLKCHNLCCRYPRCSICIEMYGDFVLLMLFAFFHLFNEQAPHYWTHVSFTMSPVHKLRWLHTLNTMFLLF
jgi:hypothetical protein